MKKNRISHYVISLLFLLGVSCAVLWFLGLGVLPAQSYIKSQFYEFYREKDIDTIFVGPSLVYRALDPEIVDGLCGTHSFNLGTSSQKPIDSYYVIKEAIRTQPIKQVVLDVSQSFYMDSAYTAQNQSTYLIYDRMQHSQVKKEYVLDAFEIDQLPFVLFKASHYDFPSLSEFIANLKSAFNEDEPVPIIFDNEWYTERGYVCSNQVYKGDAEIVQTNAGINEEELKRLEEIVQYCQEEDVRLIVVSSPKAKEYLDSVQHYRENNMVIAGMLAEYGLEYYDFSVMDEHQVFTNDCFTDAVHLNGHGAELYSQMIVNLINDAK